MWLPFKDPFLQYFSHLPHTRDHIYSSHVTKKRGTQTTTRPLWPYCIACGWSSIQHSHINRACTSTFTDPDSSEPPANTISAQGFQDGISWIRLAQKVSANTNVQPRRTSNKVLTSICLLLHSPPETDHSKLLISCNSPPDCSVLQPHSLLDPILPTLRSWLFPSH